MSQLSVFIDESGDFGTSSDLYLLTLVFHDQSKSISRQLKGLEASLRESGFSTTKAIHTAPLVRKYGEYENESLKDRRKIFDKLVTFARLCDISYKTFIVRKKEYPSLELLQDRLFREVDIFLREHREWLGSFNGLIVYYDNGQAEISQILKRSFSNEFAYVEFRKVYPSDYRLFQCADLFCTLELMRCREQLHINMTHSEEVFFQSRRRFKKVYLRVMDKMRIK